MRQVRSWAIVFGTGVAALADCVSAQLPGRGVARFEVAPAQAGPWSSSLSVAPGAPVFMRLLCGWETSASVAGFAGAMFDDIRFNGADASDGFSVSENPNWTPTPDVTGPFTLWKRQAARREWGVFNTPTGRKLDLTVDPEGAGRIVVGQSTAEFDPSNPLLNVLFRFTAGAAPAGPRTIAVTAPFFRSSTPAPTGNHFLLYTDMLGTSSKLAGDAFVESASVTIVPTPGAAAWLALALAAARRRR
jgi:uncharacterized protein (TIGR03382 family)